MTQVTCVSASSHEMGQLFSLHGLSGVPDAPELMAQFGGDGVEQLWASVYRESGRWLRSLHFGFHELDYIPCLLY